MKILTVSDRSRRGLLAGVVAFAALPALAQPSAVQPSGDAAALPEVQHAGRVSYLTGGVGADEAQVMKQAMNRYPLVVEVVRHAGQRDIYTADADVQVKDGRGDTVLQTRTDGPFLLADLPAGTYRVEVTLDGQTKSQQIAVHQRGSARGVFVFLGEG